MAPGTGHDCLKAHHTFEDKVCKKTKCRTNPEDLGPGAGG
eukprot:CAMPEP_0174295288 /NCGR_PEP_ID=MMETSP0809-20121228/44291_1 /TAXON_ID=73025 ORGANISM="Eutreptiella gymnastica-like, Strain CCMP1594" /NCGR_SAMPLE_ID=MMETSP0809 /ASSEMBLY_ACC=CAM_ASM_000658 /LENGTH=39 /DNA_ID= /DNA_START= /DNA_END= /DNA_ORIENTATION=